MPPPAGAMFNNRQSAGPSETIRQRKAEAEKITFQKVAVFFRYYSFLSQARKFGVGKGFWSKLWQFPQGPASRGYLERRQSRKTTRARSLISVPLASLASSFPDPIWYSRTSVIQTHLHLPLSKKIRSARCCAFPARERNCPASRNTSENIIRINASIFAESEGRRLPVHVNTFRSALIGLSVHFCGNIGERNPFVSKETFRTCWAIQLRVRLA